MVSSSRASRRTAAVGGTTGDNPAPAARSDPAATTFVLAVTTGLIYPAVARRVLTRVKVLVVCENRKLRAIKHREHEWRQTVIRQDCGGAIR